MIMIYFGITGKIFSEAGWRNLVVQSNIIAIRSIDKILSGKMYIRTVRVHKVMSEVLYKCLLNKMEENHADNF